MTTSHLTPRILVAVILAAIAIGVPVTAQRVSESELLLREALHKQQVQGDLPGAIKIYQQIVSATNTNRAVAARALLELAGCYEKLGQQAEAVYQRIVRDFGEQPVAVQARARLAALRPAVPAPAMTLRKLEVGDDVLQVVATDGRRALFVGLDGMAFLGDLTGKERRALGQVFTGQGMVSRDLSVIAAYRAQTQQFSIFETDGTGERVLELRENGRPVTMPLPGPFGMTWSWDNRYVLMRSPDEAGSRLLRITAADGTVTDVLPGRSGVTLARFSPDGAFIAYSRGGIYVVPSGGGESHLIATGVALVDWTRDGRHVLVMERSADGRPLLSAVPVQDGRTQGERGAAQSIPAPAVGTIVNAATMMNGSLFLTYEVPPLSVRDTWVGILDDGSITWTAMDLAGPPIANTLAAWSPDATRFAYVTGDVRQSGRVVRVKNVATGEDRELYRGDRIIGCVAAHREDVLFCARVVGADMEVVSMPFDSGRAEIRGTLRRQEMASVVQMTMDDRNIVFYRRQTNTQIEWDIETGEEREVPLYRSPDARWSLVESSDSTTGNALRIRPAVDGGDWRVLVARRVPPPGNAAPPWRFSPDGNWVVYHDRDIAGNDGLYRIATPGGEPQRLGDYPTSIPTSAISISGDGRRFVVHAPKDPSRQPTRDYWLLENFRPATSGATPIAMTIGR